MGRELQIQQPFSLPPPPFPPLPPPSTAPDDQHHPSSSSLDDAPSQPPPYFDASRMVGIIRRKALIKDLAALYHAECLTYCQELLELQKKLDEPSSEVKAPENSRKDVSRPPKRLKRTR
ncbi:hypothetical protein F511_38083 [Dorcoceras hygrometricum]|uniref:Uncharacterized protein n=1 Tax=Dorcoceras hygrometricum TaxID=472368 RepID=A0A2Z7C3N8_9LAMI|nr:hypothetical protein F511_38083 [Dorcoceras hygrometricum]